MKKGGIYNYDIFIKMSDEKLFFLLFEMEKRLLLFSVMNKEQSIIVKRILQTDNVRNQLREKLGNDYLTLICKYM